MIRQLTTTVLIFMLMLLITGCATRRQDTTPYQKQTAKAERLLTTGNPQQAAQIYQHLAETHTSNRHQLRLRAAEALLQSGNDTKALEQIKTIDPNGLSLVQLNVLKLLTGQIHLNSGDSQQALEQFHFIIPLQLNKHHKISYYQSLAFAYSLQGQLIESVKTRIALTQLITRSELQKNNSAAIMETLNQVPISTLNQFQKTTTGTLGGWLSLAALLRSHRVGSDDFYLAFSNWQRRYPKHQGNTINLENHQSQITQQQFQLPQSIAVLLPESGPYAKASKAIRAGIMAGFYNPDTSAFQPEIKFYDTNASEIQSLYHQTINSGAELIIGPLQKNNIERLAQLANLSTPVLALNRISELTKDNLYQFGLSPEDEAEQIAAKALKDGHRKALILVPDTTLGQRIAKSFGNAWQQADGRILEAQAYNPKASDYSYPIKKLLNLNESIARARNIKQLLPSVQFTPRRRHDVDAILMAGRPRDARLLNPQLRFYRATRVPIYATSQVYAGRPNPSQDIDLDNISFSDIPWLFSKNYSGPLSMNSQKHNWKKFPVNYLRLFALGIDAYSLLPHLDTMATKRYHGATGNLSLNQENQIKRDLVCAKFAKGIANSSGFINSDSVGTNTTLLTRPYGPSSNTFAIE